MTVMITVCGPASSGRKGPFRCHDDTLPARRRCCAKPSQGASSPAPAAPSPSPPGASVPRAGAAAHEPREPVHTHQPLARSAPAPPRAPSAAAPTPKPLRRVACTPRRAPHLSRAAQTPETDAEHARVCGVSLLLFYSFRCHELAPGTSRVAGKPAVVLSQDRCRCPSSVKHLLLRMVGFIRDLHCLLRSG